MLDIYYLTNIFTPSNSEFEFEFNFDFDFDNCVVYCQNSGCQNVITPLFCSESENNGPTAQPTNRPTESNYEKSISGFIHFIENNCCIDFIHRKRTKCFRSKKKQHMNTRNKCFKTRRSSMYTY